MKKTLIGIAAGLVVLLGAVLVVPGLIDWSHYKDRMRDLVYAQTGRDLTIDGDIRLAMLPTPAFSVSEVRLSNPEGVGAGDMLRLGKLEINLAVLPLFSGEFHVLSARLIEPEIYLQRFADGRTNLTPSPAAKTEQTQTSTAETGALDVRMDSFVIENGVLSYHDAQAATEERLEGINARIALVSLEGPFEATGSMNFRGFPVRFDVVGERLINGQTLPFRLDLGLPEKKAQMRFVGAVTDLPNNPALRGKLTLSAERLGALVGQGAGAHHLFNRDVEISADVEADKSAGKLTRLALRLGEIQGSGTVAAAFGETPSFEVDLAAPRVDLDSLINRPPPKEAQESAVATGEGGAAGFSMPSGLSASVNLSVEALTYNDGLIRQGRARFLLDEGELHIKQLSAQFPGGSKAAVTGILSTPKEGPDFAGSVDLHAGDLRRLLVWLGVSFDPVSASHLRVLRAHSKIRTTADLIQFPGLDITLDTSRLTGGLSVARRERLAFGADLSIDRINVDAYLPKEDSKTAAAAGGGVSPMKIGGGLDFDANLRLKIGEAVIRGLRVQQISFDGTYDRGDLTLRDLRIGHLAGTRLALKGVVTDLDGVPAFKEVSLSAATKDIAGLAMQTGINLPEPVTKIGAVSVSVKADGTFLMPRIEAVSRLAGGQVQLTGKVNLLRPSALFDGALSLQHADAKKLAARFVPADGISGNLGSLSLKTGLKGGATGAVLTGLDLHLGETRLRGQLDLDLSRSRPRINADLTGGRILLDPFVGDKTSSTQAKKRPPGSGRADRFSKEPVDLSALDAVDGALNLRAEALAYDAYELENADLAATLEDGVLQLSHLKGRLFEGALTGQFRVSGSARPDVRGKLSLGGVQLARALSAVTDKAPAGGVLAVEFEGGSSGRSPFDLVAALTGRGSFNIQKIDVKSTAQGSALAPLLDLVLGLNTLGAGALQGKAKQDEAAIGGSFVVDQGGIQSDDLSIVTGLGSGSATARIDLVNWRVDGSGSIRMAQTPLMALLAQEVNIPKSMDFEVSGPLDGPNVRLRSAPTPRVLPPTTTTPRPLPPTTTTPGRPPPPPPGSDKPSPEDLLRGLLGGLGN